MPIVKGVIDLNALLAAHDGILLAREHRPRKSSLSRWCRAGRLARILPGVYVHPAARDDLATRLRAVHARVPDAVIGGSAAARLTAWPDETVTEVEVNTTSRRVPKPGFRFVRRRVPPEHTHRRGPLSVIAAPLIAVDSAAADKGERIDHLLRKRWPLAGIEVAMAATPNRRGNRIRRRVVRRSRTNPWSQAERVFHDLLDRHHVTGWVANQPESAGDGRYQPDVAFRAGQVACEIDGYEYHSGKRMFLADRVRQNALALAGWTVLRFTWDMLADEEEVVATIRAANRLRRGNRKRGAG